MNSVLQNRSIALVGLGGLGAPAARTIAESLVEMGSEQPLSFLLIDPDRVETSNLPRQWPYEDAAVGRLKVEATAESMTSLLDRASGDYAVATCARAIDDGESALDLFARVDFVIDGTDSPDVKFLMNSASLSTGTPLSHGGVAGTRGQATTIVPPSGPCLRCLFEESAESESLDEQEALCQSVGVLSPLPTAIGAIQASEALGWVRERRVELCGRLAVIEIRADGIRMPSIHYARRPDCPECGCADRPPLPG